MEKLILYAFCYCDNIHESSYATISLHRTKAGAKKALSNHKEKEKKEWDEIFSEEEQRELNMQFGQHEDWSIEEIEVED